MVAYLQRRHYSRPGGRCAPVIRAISLEQVTALCRYRGIDPEITRELLDRACASYFVGRRGRRRVRGRTWKAAEDAWMCLHADAAMSDFAARADVGASVRAAVGEPARRLREDRPLTGLLLLVSESLVVILTSCAAARSWSTAR